MGKYIICPFYLYDRGTKIRCEKAARHFKNREKLKHYRNRFCGSMEYKKCNAAIKMIKKYEEEENG